MSALTLAAGSNVTGTTGQLLQATAVNTLIVGGDAALAKAAATLEMENNSVGMLPGSKLGLWLAQPPDGDVLSTAKLEETLAEKNLELASYLGGLPFVIAHDATQDIAALHKGETTLEAIARQRGIQYVTGALVGKLAQKGIGIAVQGGRLALAPIANNIQRSVAIQQSQKVVYRTLNKLGINLRPTTTPAGQVVIIKPQVAKLADTGMQWGQGIAKQGHAWENYCAKQVAPGSRLPPNFKTFDFFDEKMGVAISAKSLDTLTPAKLAKPQQIYSTMKNKMIDPIIDFRKHEFNGKIVNPEEILRREIHLAIPKGTRPAQWEQINRGIQYAQDNGIQITITVIKP